MPRRSAAERRQRRGRRGGESTQAWWANATPEERQAAIQKSFAGYARKHPDRAALIEATHDAIRSGQLVPEPCSGCGGEAKPVYDWASLTVVGWRCTPCRKIPA